MIGFGLNAYSISNGRNIRYADYVDPCLEHKVRLRDVDWSDVPGYLTEELLELNKGLVHYQPQDILRMAKDNIRLAACFWLQQAALAKTLFSGEAGGFITSWHPDTVAHVLLYNRSRFNHAGQWQQRFRELPNVDTDVQPGVHMTGVNPQVLKNTVGRVVLAQNLMQAHYTPQEMHDEIAQWKPPIARPRHLHLPHFINRVA
jgi:hypothetical protein